MNNRTKKLVTAAMLAAFTTVATMVIKFPTPTFGYIHLGDSLVLLCGIILGPVTGALAAGIGSMFADLFAGYVSFSIGTLLIKAVTAYFAGMVYHKMLRVARLDKHCAAKMILAGIPAEALMVIGYFLYEILLAVLAAGSLKISSIISASTASAAGIPFNIIQGISGIVIAAIALPVLLKISDIRELTIKNSSKQC